MGVEHFVRLLRLKHGGERTKSESYITTCFDLFVLQYRLQEVEIQQRRKYR